MRIKVLVVIYFTHLWFDDCSSGLRLNEPRPIGYHYSTAIITHLVDNGEIYRPTSKGENILKVGRIDGAELELFEEVLQVIKVIIQAIKTGSA